MIPALLLAAALAAPDEACAVAAAVTAKAGGVAAPMVRGKSTSGDLFLVPLRLAPGLRDDVRKLLQTPDASAPGEAVDCTAAFGPAQGEPTVYYARPVFAARGRLAAVYRWSSVDDEVRIEVVVARKARSAWSVSDSFLISAGEP